MWQEFKSFLTKTNALAMAVGVVIGAAVGKVVSALVDDVFMPIVGLVTPEGDWREIAFGTKGVFKIGHLAGALVDFVVIAFVVFLVTKALLREEPKAPPPSKKDCPFCLAQIPLAATKCQMCTSVLA